MAGDAYSGPLSVRGELRQSVMATWHCLLGDAILSRKWVRNFNFVHSLGVSSDRRKGGCERGQRAMRSGPFSDPGRRRGASSTGQGATI